MRDGVLFSCASNIARLRGQLGRGGIMHKGFAGRHEDWRLLTGQGSYLGDTLEADTWHAGFVRAPVQSGRLVALDTRAAAALPGVAAILTADDLAADGIG
ncbi:hypothetical protein LCGC14_2531680, partial [marine sediment metagenome]